MPVYQTRRDWLQEAVGSALDQRGCQVELIVVDDGSPEPVRECLRGIDDPRLRLIRIEHAGPSGARNAGFAEARGNWIRFIDSDDVLEPDSTRHLASFMDGDAVIAYGATLVCDEELRPTRIIGSTLQGNVSFDCLLGRFETRLPALLFPRRVVEAAGPWDATFCVSEDWDFVLRTLDHACVAGDGRVALRYRRHARSASRTASIAAGEAMWGRLMERYFERHRVLRRTPLYRRARAALYLDRGFAYWDRQDYRRALRRLSLALFLDPAAAGKRVCGSAAWRARRYLRSRRIGSVRESAPPSAPIAR